MMAMAFTAGADALIGCLEAKYLYMLVARCVRSNGEHDGNLDTDPDPTWTAFSL